MSKGISRRSPTSLARKAIADFVDANVPRFSGWLDQVAGGIPQYDKDGVVQYDSKGVPVWLVRPDPLAALKVVTDIAEYHLPRLSRSEATVVAQVEATHHHNLTPEDLRRMPLADLKRLALERMGSAGMIIDAEVVEPVPVDAVEVVQALPDWLTTSNGG